MTSTALPPRHEQPTAELPSVPAARAQRRFADRLPTGRIVAIDVARFAALIGMAMAHLGSPYRADESEAWWHPLVDGRASALFAVLAGVSLALMTGGTTPAHGTRSRRTYVALGVRALIVFAVGLALSWNNDFILVILPVYAVLFVLALPFLRFRARTLLLLGGIWAALGPVILAYAATHGHTVGSGDNLTFADVFTRPGHTAEILFLGGGYPAVVWFAYVLIGAGIGRLDLRSWKPAAWLAAVGAGCVAIARAAATFAPAPETILMSVEEQFLSKIDPASGAMTGAEMSAMKLAVNKATYGDPMNLLAIEPHTGTIADLVNTIGSALLVIGVCLLLVRGGFRIWSVVFGAGAMTLTLYVLHIQLANWQWPLLQHHSLIANVVALTMIGMVFGILRRSGPAEKAVAVISKRAAALVPEKRS